MKFQKGYERTTYIEKILPSIGSNTIKVFSGLRRVGKSYLLKQIIQKLLQGGIPIHSMFYLHLEDERLIHFDVDALRSIFEFYRSHHYQ